jgi:hypothetical protein
VIRIHGSDWQAGSEAPARRFYAMRRSQHEGLSPTRARMFVRCVPRCYYKRKVSHRLAHQSFPYSVLTSSTKPTPGALSLSRVRRQASHAPLLRPAYACLSCIHQPVAASTSASAPPGSRRPISRFDRSPRGSALPRAARESTTASEHVSGPSVRLCSLVILRRRRSDGPASLSLRFAVRQSWLRARRCC